MTDKYPVVKIKISDEEDRRNMITGLIVAGYRVWLEEKTKYLPKSILICFDMGHIDDMNLKINQI